MDVDAAGGGDEFLTRVRLQSVNDGAAVVRSGRSVVYGGTAWRGRSQGASAANAAPDDLSTEAREVMWVAPDGSKADGRWFWGQYDELGFDVTMQRASPVITRALWRRSRANRAASPAAAPKACSIAKKFTFGREAANAHNTSPRPGPISISTR